MAFANGGAQGVTINSLPRGFQPAQAPIYEHKIIKLVKAASSSQGYWYRPDNMGTPSSSDGDMLITWNNIGVGTGDLTQATDLNKPLIKLDILNASRVLRFDGVDDRLVNTTPAWVSGGVGCVAMVIKFADTTGVKYVLTEGDGGNQAFVRINGATELELGSDTPKALTTDVDTNWKIYVLSIAPGGCTAYINGVSDTVAAGSPNTLSAGGLSLGANSSGSSAKAFDIAELIVARGVIWTATNMLDISNYLNRKFRIY